MTTKTTRQLLLDLTQAGKSQHEIRRQTGVSQATLSRILSGSNQSAFARGHQQILNYHEQVFQALASD